MIRLINDSKILDEEISSLDNITFDQMIEAIHVVQTELGISGISAEEAAEMVANGTLTEEEAFERLGTTAKEAADTIEGSVGSMKAAWQNLLVELAKDDGDVSLLMDYFVASFETAANNMIPRITTVLSSMGDLVAEIAPIISDKLPEVIQTVLPSLLQTSAVLMSSLVSGIAQSAPAFMDAAISLMAEFSRTIAGSNMGGESMIANLIKELTKRLPLLFRASKLIIESLVSGFKTNFGQISGAAIEFIETLGKLLIKETPRLLKSGIKIIKKISEGISENISEIALNASEIVKFLSEQISENLPEVIDAALSIIIALADAISQPDVLKNLVDSAVMIITTIADTLIDPEVLTALLDAALNIITNLAEALTDPESVEKLAASAGEIIKTIAEFLTDVQTLIKISSAGAKIIENLIIGIGSVMHTVRKIAEDTVQNFMDVIGLGEYYRLGRDVLDEFFSGMSDRVMNSINIMKNLREIVMGAFFGKDDTELSAFANAVYVELNREGAHDGAGHSRNARGGIITHTTYDRFGNLYGEAGREVILPLDNNTDWMDDLAARLNAGRNSGVTVQTLNINMEGMTIANDYDTDRFIERISQKLAALNVRQARATGGTGWL